MKQCPQPRSPASSLGSTLPRPCSDHAALLRPILFRPNAVVPLNAVSDILVMKMKISPVELRRDRFSRRELTPCPKSYDDDEDIEIVRYSLDQLGKLIRSGEIVDAKTIIGIQCLLLPQR